MSKILLVSGTDPSGAGLQTDWQVTHHLNVTASSIVTAVTSQNREGVFDQGVLPYSQIKSQLDSVKSESFTAIKIGMLGNEDVIKAVVEFIQLLNSKSEKNNRPAVILDPVLASSSGDALINDAGKEALLKGLLPLITLITPNIHELESLVDVSINSYKDIESAAQKLISLGAKNVLVKGGHFRSDNIPSDNKNNVGFDVRFKNNSNNKYSNDFFISSDDSTNIKGEKENFYLKGERWQDRSNVRGTGCSLATTIACQLSQGFPLNDAVVYAKALISNGIRNATLTENGQLKLCFNHYVTQHPFELVDMPKLVKEASLLSKNYQFASCNSKAPNNSLGIYPVVDSVEWLEKLIPLGIETIQLRIKDRNQANVEDDIIAAIKLGHKYNVRLFINDYWALAVKHKAYGIHLGQEDIDTIDDASLTIIAQSGCRLGVSTHSYTEVSRALQITPSYLALGPIFATTSKVMPWIPQGIPAVKNWVGLLNKDYPLVAIGGINFGRVEALKQTGIGSVAMISEITKAINYKEAIQALLKLWAS